MTRPAPRLLPAALAVALLAAACGEGAPVSGLSFALSSGLAAATAQLQIAFVHSSATLDCARATSKCLRDVVGADQLEPLLGPAAFEGKKAMLVPLATSPGGSAEFEPQVAAGTYLVDVEGIDADGHLTGNACALSVTLSSGATRALTLTLAPSAVQCSPAIN